MIGSCRQVVLMGNEDPKPWVAELLTTRAFYGKLHYIRGHPLDMRDSQRAKLAGAEMVRHRSCTSVFHHSVNQYELQQTNENSTL
eukprot:4081718-Pyramimonas_sp.AAC.1